MSQYVLFEIHDDIKMLRETLCLAQGLINRAYDCTDHVQRKYHSDRIQSLIDECDHHRPLGVNGKHGNLHTETCGCEDKGPESSWGTRRRIVEVPTI